jgi:excisionase family DNA binding protein
MAGQTMLLRATEVAKIMGISLRAVYRLTEKKKLPFVKWDRSVRFDAQDVENFIENNKVKPTN